MARGNKIIVSADPQGTFMEGTVSGTPKPGTLMEIVPATALTRGGRPTFRAKSLTAGSKGPVFVLLEDDLQGFSRDTAYVSGKPCRIYAPIAGEELNLIVASVAGTADDIAIGDLMGIDANGKLHANSSYTSAPFAAMEVITDPTADYWLWVQYLGNNA